MNHDRIGFGAQVVLSANLIGNGNAVFQKLDLSPELVRVANGMMRVAESRCCRFAALSTITQGWLGCQGLGLMTFGRY
jgi:hypothetical protein